MYATTQRSDRSFRLSRIAKVQATAVMANERKLCLEGGAEILRAVIKDKRIDQAHWHMHTGALAGWALLTPSEQCRLVDMSNQYAEEQHTSCYTIRFGDFPPKKRSLLARWFA